MEANHVIYLPGFGDEHSRGQVNALNSWKLLGLQAHYHMIGWEDKEPFASKLDSVVEQIDSLSPDNRLSIIGVSAGASMALNAFAARKDKINKVVFICGKIQNPQTISDDIYEEHPAFKGSMEPLPDLLANLTDSDRSKMLCIHPLKDYRVGIEDTVIDGAKEKVTPTIGHVFSIAYTLTLGSFGIRRFIKS